MRLFAGRFVRLPTARLPAIISQRPRFRILDLRHGFSIVVHPRRLAASDMTVKIAEREDEDFERGLGAARVAKRHFVVPRTRCRRALAWNCVARV
jgi:hypothetical protein